MQFNFAHRNFEQNGKPTGFYPAPGLKFSDVPMPDARKNYGQNWTRSEITTDRYGLDVKWVVNDAVSLRAGAQSKTNDYSPYIYSYGSTLYADGTFDLGVASIGSQKSTNKSVYAFSDIGFDTGLLRHKMVVGINGFFGEYSFTSDNWSDVTLTGLSLNHPYVEKPVFGTVGSTLMYVGRKTIYRSIIVGDDIRFGEKWSALVGINRTFLSYGMFDKYGAKSTSFYEKWANTPTLSLIYKPQPWLTTYATYIEALQQGAVVGDAYKNFGQVFQPMVNKQVEIGAKINVDNMLLSTALFKMDGVSTYEHYANLSDILKTMTQDGKKEHMGVEFTAVGKLTNRLSLVGGMTFFNAKQIKTSNPSLKGRRPAQVSEKMAKIYGEYTLTSVEGLFLNGGVNWMGSFYYDSENTEKLPAQTVMDAGLRYETRINTNSVTARLYVCNFTNKSYWNSSGGLGEPRTIAFSLTTKF